MSGLRNIEDDLGAIQFRLALEEMSRAENIFEGVIYMVGRSKNPLILTDGSRLSAERVFTGALMFADHPSASEEWDRPERSTRSVVGKVLSAYSGDYNGEPALLGKFLISKGAQWLLDLIDDGILDGLSLNAYADGSFDEKEGVFILERFLDPEVDNVMPASVDVVTYPAARGKLGVRLSKTFSQKRGIIIDNDEKGTPATMSDDKQVQLAQENELLKAQMARQKVGLKLHRETLESVSHLPQATQNRIMQSVESVIEGFADKGGEYSALEESVAAIVNEETQYLQSMIGAGKPQGVSAATPQGVSDVSDAWLAKLTQEFDAITLQ